MLMFPQVCDGINPAALCWHDNWYVISFLSMLFLKHWLPLIDQKKSNELCVRSHKTKKMQDIFELTECTELDHIKNITQ